MKPNGQWEVAYENKTLKPTFTDITDLRPTFYGLLIAYEILKDKKYLQAAIQGSGLVCGERCKERTFPRRLR